MKFPLQDLAKSSLILTLLSFLFMPFGLAAVNKTAIPGSMAVTDMGATALVAPSSTGCYTANENVTVTIQNYTSTPIDFSVDPVTVTVNITGAITQTLTTTLNSGVLNGNSSQNVIAGTLNMSAPGTYTFNAYTSTAGDGNTANDAMPAATRTVQALASLPQTIDFTGFNGTNLTALFPMWREAVGVSPTGTTSAWRQQVGVGGQSNTTARINLFTTTRNEWIIGPRVLASANTTLRFKAAVTDFSVVGNPDVMGPDDKVRVMISTNCGASWTPVMTIDTSYHLQPALKQLGLNLGAYAGQEIIIAFYATDGPVDDINNYDFHIDDVRIEDLTGSDVGVTALLTPTGAGCLSRNDSVKVQLTNHGFLPINFSTDNVTVTGNAAGPNPQAFSVTVNSGTLLPGASMPVTLSSTYDMHAPGIYNFTASAAATNDYDPSNNAMAPVYVVSTTPVVTASADIAICAGSGTQINAAASAYGPTTSVASPFISTVSIPIPDQDTIQSTITVSSPLYAFDLFSVTIDSLHHTFDADMDIYLIAPNGSRIELTTDNGSNSDNYIGTRFIASATNSIISGFGPFTGDFLPEQPFTQLSGSANGAWTLEVIDDGLGDTGTLKGWHLNMKSSNNIVSYSWTPTTGLSSANNSSTIANPLVTTTYTVTVADQNGCTQQDSVTVTVNELPVLSATSSYETCSPGNDGTATVNAAGGSGNYSYAWSNGETTGTISGLAAQAYTVTVTDAVTACSSVDSVTVNPSVPPVVLISNDTTICAGSQATLNASGGSVYSWDNNAGSTSSVQVAPADTTVYTVTVTDTNGCIATGQVTVNVAPLAVASFSYNNTGNTITFTNSSLNSTSWSWDFGDNSPLDNNMDPVHTYQPGVYTVILSASNSCGSDTAMQQVAVISTGISEVNNDLINIYPNPNEGTFILSMNNASNSDLIIEIIDPAGRIVYNTIVYSSIVNYSGQVTLPTSAPGIYTVRAINGENMSTIRLFIH